MQPEPETSRGPPEPYVIDGQNFYNVRQATQIIGTISAPTLWRWAAHGSTPFGFELGIRREPMIHDPRGLRRETKIHRQDRMLIPEEKVLQLQEILRDDPIRSGPLSQDAMHELEAAARRHRQTLPQHGSNSPKPR